MGVSRWLLVILGTGLTFLYTPFPGVTAWLQAGIVFIALTLLMAVYVGRSSRNSYDDELPTIDTKGVQQRGWRCSSCGHGMDENQTKCPKCGYTIFDRDSR